MLNVQDSRLVFTFPEVHPEARFEIDVQQTLRVPDDGKRYDLPPGLRALPLRAVAGSLAEKMGPAHAARGGVATCLYQADALWLRFKPAFSHARRASYPCAIMVAAGRVNAVTGKPWGDGAIEEGNYMVAPKQLWIDGFAVRPGVVAQFVCAPLGAGYTVEGQLTGAEEFGGLQIWVAPMKAAEYERRFPVLPPQGVMRGGGARGMTVNCLESNVETRSYTLASAAPKSMGLAAGGSINQQIFADEFGLFAWEASAGERTFVHLMNSGDWRHLTGEAPPGRPPTAADYSAARLPWFAHYAEGIAIGNEGGAFDGVKTAAQIDAEKGGVALLPENESCTTPVVLTVPAKPKGNVSPGEW